MAISKEEQKKLDAEYARELRNLKRRVKTKEKRGYSVSKNVIPKKPKVIRPESIQNLKKRTGEYIAKRSIYVSPTGTIRGEVRLKQERSEAAKKGAETRRNDLYKWWNEEPSYEPSDELYLILNNLVEDFESWTPSDYWSKELADYKRRDRDRGWGILQGAINELGETVVAENAKKHALRLTELENKILYESGNEYKEDARTGEINNALNEFNELLRGRALTRQESIVLTSEAEMTERHEPI